MHAVHSHRIANFALVWTIFIPIHQFLLNRTCLPVMKRQLSGVIFGWLGTRKYVVSVYLLSPLVLPPFQVPTAHGKADLTIYREAGAKVCTP